MDRKNHAKVKYSVSVAMPKSRKVQIRNTAMFSAIEVHIYKKNAVSMYVSLSMALVGQEQN